MFQATQDLTKLKEVGSRRDWSNPGQSEPVRKKIQKMSLLGKNSGETTFPHYTA